MGASARVANQREPFNACARSKSWFRILNPGSIPGGDAVDSEEGADDRVEKSGDHGDRGDPPNPFDVARLRGAISAEFFFDERIVVEVIFGKIEVFDFRRPPNLLLG